MSDNEDLLGDDLGDHSLADYNLGNEEEDQLLADDYESGASQNVPTSIPNYGESVNMVPTEYPRHEIQYNQPIQYHLQPDTECVVPNITVEVPNTTLPEHSTYAPYEPPPVFETEHAVPPPIPAAPLESPQIVPSEMAASLANGDVGGPRERFISERPPGVQRMPQVRDIPDSLDKVVVPRGGGRGRTWQHPRFAARFHNNPYRRNNMHRGNFNQRPSFPPPQIRPNPPQNRPEIRPEMPPDIRPEIRPEIRPDLPPQMGPEISPERPILPNMPLDPFRMDMRPFAPRFPQFRPNMEEPRQNFAPNMRPNFERPMFYQRPPFRPFGPPIREVTPNSINLPQVTLRHPMPGPGGPPTGPKGPMVREPEVRMLPVQLPPNLPPGGLAGKKVLINPHFKGNFQPPGEGPIKDIDDAAERFIAEQRNALARAANRKFPQRRSPQRYIENTTIEIENELAPRPRDDADLLRRQEEFINANRAGLRRRMRSPSPPARRSVSPRRSPERARPRSDTARPPLSDEESEYRRRLREQENMRERVLRAKEARRRKNAVASHQLSNEKERERLEKEKAAPKPEDRPEVRPPPSEPLPRPDTTRKSPDREDRGPQRDRSPIRDEAEVNSTCENLTPPREELPKQASPERDLTPPLPSKRDKEESDDDIDLILDDIDGILSDDDDTGRFKDKSKKPEPPKPKQVDLRSKLPPKSAETKRPPRQKIVFHEKEKEKEDRKKKDKSPPRRTIVTSSTKTEDTEKKTLKAKEKSESSKEKARQKIIFDKEQKEKEETQKPQFSNRRVILQRKITQQPKEKSVFARIEIKTDPSKPNPGIFSRAVRTAIGKESRIVIKKEEPQIEYESESEIDEDKLLEEDIGMIAVVTNLPHGMTDTRMKTLAGNDVQSLSLDKEDRSAKITFKTTVAAESFKKKFNNKMVAASRLTVTLR